MQESFEDLALHYSDQLQKNGFVLCKDVLSPKIVKKIYEHVERLYDIEGNEAGKENLFSEPGVKRLANLADKGRIFLNFYAHSTILSVVSCLLGSFNLVMLNARKTLLSTEGKQRQEFHTDTDLNQNNGLPDSKGFFSCTAVLFLTESTIDNGATRIVPGSHLFNALPQDSMKDLTMAHPDEIAITGNAGDVCVFNGHCWHCGGGNQAFSNRMVLLAHYLRSDIHRDEHRKQYLSSATIGELSKKELRLLENND